MKLIFVLTALLTFADGLALAAGPADSGKAPAQAAVGFELRVPAPGPNALADEILQKAIDTVADAGGGVVLLGNAPINEVGGSAAIEPAVGCRDMKGAPKQAEKVATGSVTPRSVPATLAVYPARK